MRLAAVAAVVLTAGSCGYQVAGRADLVPENVRTIAVPAFQNATTRYRLTEALPRAIGREFISRTRYHIVAEPEGADAVLLGTITEYLSYPVVSDGASGALGIQTLVVMSIHLVEQPSGNIIFRQDGMQVQNRYEVSADQMVYFDESDSALDRLSADAARTVVSAILENF